MGRVISSLVNADSQCEIVAGVDPCNINYDKFPVFSSFDNLPEADVIIDFSHPSALDGIIKYAAIKKIPVVFSTTGYSESEIEKIKAASQIFPVFFSFNMSLGINLLCAIAAKAASVLGRDFDIEIIERHHNQKIDAPSGTAIMLANTINDVLDNRMIYEYDRHSKRQKRSENEIGIHAVRGGTIVGDHEVVFAGKDEVISLRHEAFSKEIFAAGAIKAAKFITGKPAGLYDMNNVITAE